MQSEQSLWQRTCWRRMPLPLFAPSCRRSPPLCARRSKPQPLVRRWGHPQVSLSLSLGVKGLYLYTVGILCHVECCIRQLWCSSIILYNITSIAHDHHINIYPLSSFKHINIHIYLQRSKPRSSRRRATCTTRRRSTKRRSATTRRPCRCSHRRGLTTATGRPRGS